MTTKGVSKRLVVDRSLVMTDIVGSTELICRIGDEAYGHVIEHHDRELLDCLRLVGGEFIRSQGDGMLVAFTAPSAAMQWVNAVDEALTETPDLRIRTGAHSGSVRVRGSGYVGKTIHVLARITDLAGPGELAMSQDFADSVGQSEVGLADSSMLRGVAEPVQTRRISLASAQNNVDEVARVFEVRPTETRGLALAI